MNISAPHQLLRVVPLEALLPQIAQKGELRTARLVGVIVFAVRQRLTQM